MRDSDRFNARSLRIVVSILVFVWAGCVAAVSQTPSGTATEAQPQQQQSQGDNSVPDAPSAVQPPAATPQIPPPADAPRPETKKPVERDPWTNKPINQPAPGDTQAPSGSDSASGTSQAPPPPMPPVKTLPPGSSKNPNGQDQLVTFVVHSNFVQVPVSVKDKRGRPVEDLHAADFTLKENGIAQKLSFFSSDPFALSVAVILDLGMPDTAVQQVNKSLPALLGAFAPYDEVALYTYSSTVSQVSDFTGSFRKLEALTAQMKMQRGTENGPPVLGGPLAPGPPVVNNIPVGEPTQAVYTPPKEAHVLNDAILQAALDLGRRPRDRRKIIFIISDGRDQQSKASYRDVLRLLLSREIEVKAVGVEGAAIPVIRKLEQLHIPDQGRSDILPKYVRATGGGEVYSEISSRMLEDVYSEAMMEARNQYTLGYTPLPPKVPLRSAYREIEVIVHKPGLKVQAKDGYYPVLSAARP